MIFNINYRKDACLTCDTILVDQCISLQIGQTLMHCPVQSKHFEPCSPSFGRVFPSYKSIICMGKRDNRIFRIGKALCAKEKAK